MLGSIDPPKFDEALAADFAPHVMPDKREILVLEHLPQVRLIAKTIHRRLPDHVSLDDLVSHGVIGLLAAIDNFDPSLKVQLNTYADRRIRGAIIDGLRDTDWAPTGRRKRSKMVQAAIDALNQKSQKEPADEEIAAELGISIPEYHRWLVGLQAIHLEPLEFAKDGSEKVNLRKCISYDEEGWPSRVLERSELERVLALAIERLPRLERTILNLYYFEELKLREISRVVNIHLSRVAQLKSQGILRLRAHLERVWNLPFRTKK
jgi:RNA polymerase sigma factor for flagellar operon FliA